MPELPEVETVRRELEPALVGATIMRAERVAAPAGPKYQGLERAAGQKVLAVGRRGKFLLLSLSRGDELVIHLGMTGVLGFREPASHVRVRVELARRTRRFLYFQDPRRFGRFLVRRPGAPCGLPTLDRLGPEPLDPSFDDATFAAGLRGNGPVKAVLLGQRAVAGVGNIYADEALWRAGIHPLRPARSLRTRDITNLRQAIVAVLQASIEAQGTTFRDYRTVNGEVGAFASALDVYGHAGEACHRCGAVLARIVVGQRGTVFCGRCQPRQARRSAARS